MLRRRVRSGEWPRDRGGDRAVVDDPATTRCLVPHQTEGVLRAEERACQVGIEDRPPVLERNVLERDGAGGHAGVVEKKVESTVAILDGREESSDRGWLANIGSDRDSAVSRLAGSTFDRRALPTCEGDAEAGVRERDSAGTPDAAARPGDERNGGHSATGCELVLDILPNDLVEAGLGAEAELICVRGVEPLRPARR